MPIDTEIIDKLLKDYKSPEDVLGEDGLLKQFTRAVLERAMQAELTRHLSYEPLAPEGKNSGNSRNGKSKKTLKGFPEVIQTVFPQAQVQLCIVHLVRQSLQYVGYKERKAVASDLQKIYRGATREEAELELDRFAEKWGAKFPTISQTWRRDWERVAVFFAYPPEIQRVIYTTNAIELTNMSPRKILKVRGSFPTDEAAMKLIYLALQNITARWTMPIKGWRAAFNRFAILFAERMPVTM